tara:strand:+ start:3164 stop:4228 length:1065 start_codon:yes stop_codon:yes gene_type:complete
MKILKKIKIRKIILKNKVCVAPMCQYSAKNGNPTKWHFTHLEKLMNVGAGLMMVESTAVSKQGMITSQDLSLTNKENTTKLGRLVKYLRNVSDTKIGIQLSHSGRKGSALVPWIKSNFPLKIKKLGWTTIAPSGIKRDKNWPVPKEINKNEINKIVNDFSSAANRAKKIGFDCLEIHMAHGYLLHQFFSPISNKRKDDYGGNLANRCKILLEVAKRIRKIWPKDKILGARVNGCDWLKEGSKLSDCIYLSKKLKELGLDYVCVTSGGIIPKTNLKFKHGYQVFLAKKIKKEAKILVKTTGMIKNLKQGEKIISHKSADLVSYGRKFINSPYWLLKELKTNKYPVNIPNQYKRCF